MIGQLEAHYNVAPLLVLRKTCSIMNYDNIFFVILNRFMTTKL
jgi:hypothetical protein